MVTIVYPFRNRSISRVKRSLKSLENQSNNDFKVVIVDYGSEFETSNSMKELLEYYDFCDYIYSYTEYQPWSRAKALNIGIKTVTTPYVFTADIDMIFHPDFVRSLIGLMEPNKSYYFKVGFLNEKETNLDKDFDKYSIDYYSSEGAAGLSLFPTVVIKELNGYDEFFHFWGAEDNNIHMRLVNAGYRSEFHDSDVLMLHQWHRTYRNSSDVKLSNYLRIHEIVPINSKYNLQAIQFNQTKANKNGWGKIIPKEQYDMLDSPDEEVSLLTLKHEIEALGNVLENELNKTIAITLEEPTTIFKRKQKIKRLLNKKSFPWYSISEANDRLLYQLISQHRDKPYAYVVADDQKSIKLTITL